MFPTNDVVLRTMRLHITNKFVDFREIETASKDLPKLSLQIRENL